MEITVEIDDELLAKAKVYTGLTYNVEVVHQALTALVQREAALRLARLGGSQPNLTYIPRRRSKVGDPKDQ